MKLNFLGKFKYTVLPLFFIFGYCFGAEPINLNRPCSWMPVQSRSALSLQSSRRIDEANALPERDKDYLQVDKKGKHYFHALPNELCKTDVFIVKGDVVQIIDTYPKDDLSFNNLFARVIFYSKNMGGDVVGWVKIANFRRLTESEKGN
jgi:hypothetical protein